MRIESCYFSSAHSDEFMRLARVLDLTAAVHCANWDRHIEMGPRAPLRGGTGVALHIANTHKLTHWCARIEAAADGDRVLLIDADTFILRSLDEVWHAPFDLAYTTRPHHVPFNLGVIFVRVSARTRAFFDAWRDENARIFQPGNAQQVWRTRFGGVNQAAFGALLESGRLADLTLHKLPCLEWNCETSQWAAFDPAVTRIVHVNGALRRQIFHRERPTAELEPLVNRWRALERQIKNARRSA